MHTVQVVAEVHDLHLELIAVAQESQVPELLKNPVEQAPQVVPVNPEAQAWQAAPETHCKHLVIVAEQDKQAPVLSK